MNGTFMVQTMRRWASLMEALQRKCVEAKVNLVIETAAIAAIYHKRICVITWL